MPMDLFEKEMIKKPGFEFRANYRIINSDACTRSHGYEPAEVIGVSWTGISIRTGGRMEKGDVSMLGIELGDKINEVRIIFCVAEKVKAINGAYETKMRFIAPGKNKLGNLAELINKQAV